ncbi:MAG: peptide chain release factor N(5)-glutamine methyltransferase [Flavobacterium sp.]|nr:peptide chain release factor N(5)-glutamine methyltransferase [Flavobacterium sp.]
MTKIREYRASFLTKLSSIYDEMEAENFFYLILENKKKLKRIDLALNPNLIFSNDEIQNWDFILEQLKKEIPIQYVLGTTSFFGLEFLVNENVLIPRPETEELVDWILKDALKLQNLKILDIGTGSGCIAIALAKNLKNAQVSAIDVSEKAIETAIMNAKHNDVDVFFMNCNILETDDLNQKFDLIVSNPPYVRNLEKAEIQKNVLENEPHLALFVEDNDALIFYRKIAELAIKNLNLNGKLFFEINQYLASETINLLKDFGFKNIKLRKDIYGNDRLIMASLN